MTRPAADEVSATEPAPPAPIRQRRLGSIVVAALGVWLCIGSFPVGLPGQGRVAAASPSRRAVAPPSKLTVGLEGVWAAKPDASPGPVRIRDCWPNYVGYTFTRTGPGEFRVKALQVYHGGPGLHWVHAERLQGALEGRRLRLSGWSQPDASPGVIVAAERPAPRATAYDLTFDTATSHLVGTHDGQPVRLARLVLYKPVPPDECGPPPP